MFLANGDNQTKLEGAWYRWNPRLCPGGRFGVYTLIVQRRIVLLFLFEPLAPWFSFNFFTLADPVLEEEGGVEGSYASLPLRLSAAAKSVLLARPDQTRPDRISKRGC